MAEPLSIASGAVGVVAFGIQTTNLLIKFYANFKNQDADVAQTTRRLETLQQIFRTLETALRARHFQSNEREIVSQIESAIEQCDACIQELQDELDRFQVSSSHGVRNTAKAARYRVEYPFRRTTLDKLDQDVSHLSRNLSVAMDALQLSDNTAMLENQSNIKATLESIRINQVSTEIRDWLKAPDATINHNNANSKRHPGSGSWFIKSDRFSGWLDQPNSFLWVHGFAGCGKSVLCSTAIQHALRLKQAASQSTGVMYFYFSFNDASKQDNSALLRALLLQLAQQTPDGHSVLKRLHELQKSATPPDQLLIAYLRNLMERFELVYLFVDAVDESPLRKRAEVLNTLQTIRDWSLSGMHFLMTSRNEPDIRDYLTLEQDQQIVMKDAGIDEDIQNYIAGQLRIDPRLRKWENYHEQIEKTLSKRAKGVFRWVECQLQALKSLPRSKSRLDKCLNSLPRDLDESYERILCNINEDAAEDARKILTLVSFSARPLTVEELMNAIAVDIGLPGLIPENRLDDKESLLEICPGLIEFVSSQQLRRIYHRDASDPNSKLLYYEDGSYRDMFGRFPKEVVQIAHFSVQEYLESDRIKRGRASRYALCSESAHADIAKTCVAQLIDTAFYVGNITPRRLELFPLAPYAAECWYKHYTFASVEEKPLVEDYVLRLLNSQESLHTWILLYKPDLGDDAYFKVRPYEIGSAVYYASYLGLPRILQVLLSNNSSQEVNQKSLVDMRGGHYGTALCAATRESHEAVVRILLDAKADVNAESDVLLGTPLQVAKFHDDQKLARMLIDAGAKGVEIRPEVNEEWDAYMCRGGRPWRRRKSDDEELRQGMRHAKRIMDDLREYRRFMSEVD